MDLTDALKSTIEQSPAATLASVTFTITVADNPESGEHWPLVTGPDRTTAEWLHLGRRTDGARRASIEDV